MLYRKFISDKAHPAHVLNITHDIQNTIHLNLQLVDSPIVVFGEIFPEVVISIPCS